MDTSSFASLGKVAIVVAVALAIINLVLALVATLLRAGPLRIETVFDQVIGIVGDATFIMAILVLVFVGITASTLKWTVAGLYLANLVTGALFRMNYGNAITADLLVTSLFTVVLFVAIVVGTRVVRGETILPGVDIMVDVDALRVERTVRPKRGQ